MKVSKKGWVYKPQTNKRAKQSRAARKGQLKPLVDNKPGDKTDSHMSSPLGTLCAGKKVTGMVEGKVAHNVKSLDSLGTKIVKRNKVFSNAVPYGYTPKEWNEKLKRVLR